MKNRIRTTIAWALLAQSAFASTSQSPTKTTPAPSAAASQDDTFILGAPPDSVWTGRVRGTDGAFHDEALSPTFARDLRKELAAIQVSIDVERAFDAAAAKLDDVAIRATRRGYAERQAVLVEVAIARANLFEKLGQRARAKSTATSVLVNQLMPAATARYELTAPTADDKLLADAAAKDPRLVQARERLSPAAQPPASPDDKITDIVLDALDRHDKSSLLDLGDRALPALERRVAREFDVLPDSAGDALVLLTSISPRRAAEFMRIHFDDGGAVWKARMVRAMKQVSLGWAKTFWVQDNGDRKAAVPEWPPVIERLLDDPAAARDALDFLRDYLQFDALTPGLQRKLAKSFASEDTAFATAMIDVMSGGIGRESALAIFEAGLASSSADVRAFSAGVLAQYPSSAALLAAHVSPDPVVRASVAMALRGRRVARVNFSSGGTTRMFTPPAIGPREREILATLSADKSSDVRAEAASSIAELETPLAAGVYERIAADPDARVRAALLAARAIPLNVRAKIAAALASDTDPKVLASFDAFLFGELCPEVNAFNQLPIDPAFFDAIRARRLNATTSMQRSGSTRLYESLANQPEGLAALIAWACAERDAELASMVFQRFWKLLSPRLPQTESTYARAIASAAEVNIVASPQQLVALFEIVHTSESVKSPDSLTGTLVQLNDDLSAYFLPIAQDASRTPLMRFSALDIAARAPSERVGPILVDLLRNPALGSAIRSTSTLQRVKAIAFTLSGDGAHATLDSVLAKPEIDDALFAAFIAGYVRSKPLDSRAADVILGRRWQPNEEAGFRAALRQVASRSRAEQGDRLIRAVHDASVSELALTLIGDTRDPSYLPLLADCLSPTFDYRGDRNTLGLRALNALTRYFNDDAAAIILKSAGSTANSNLRDECFKALETIRKYQAEKGRWEESRTSKEAMATAVRDLVVLLDDQDPGLRAQAIRGLATLHAIEQMPRIVRMLKDTDEAVRKAADAALGVLNTPPTKDE